jgi:hypothetical protein
MLNTFTNAVNMPIDVETAKVPSAAYTAQLKALTYSTIASVKANEERGGVLGRPLRIFAGCLSKCDIIRDYMVARGNTWRSDTADGGAGNTTRNRYQGARKGAQCRKPRSAASHRAQLVADT